MSNDYTWQYLVRQRSEMLEKGFTRKEILMDIDMRFINAAGATFKYIYNGGREFGAAQMVILRFAYSVLRKHDKIDDVSNLLPEQLKEIDDDFVNWKFAEPEKYQRYFPNMLDDTRLKRICLLVMNKYAEIQLNGEPFIICQLSEPKVE